jgi:G3E family GTPase
MRRFIADPSESPRAAKTWIDAALGAASGPGSPVAHGGHEGHAAHEHDAAIASFNLIRDEPLPREALHLLLASLEKHLGSNLLRVKGLVNVQEEPGRPAVIQGAQHLLHNLTWLPEWPDEDWRTRIVFITQDLPSGELEEMVTLLDRVAHRTALARLKAGGMEPAPPI